jgi:hypothetical protein
MKPSKSTIKTKALKIKPQFQVTSTNSLVATKSSPFVETARKRQNNKQRHGFKNKLFVYNGSLAHLC